MEKKHRDNQRVPHIEFHERRRKRIVHRESTVKITFSVETAQWKIIHRYSYETSRLTLRVPRVPNLVYGEPQLRTPSKVSASFNNFFFVIS